MIVRFPILVKNAFFPTLLKLLNDKAPEKKSSSNYDQKETLSTKQSKDTLHPTIDT